MFRKQGKEIIRFNNYVGVIETKAGFTIEVLPKIHSINDIDEQRKIFLKMLRYKPKFQLIPDILIERDSNPIAILDTKWKAIDQNAPEDNYGISQADMYQLFAYGNKYEGNPILFLIYPASAYFQKELAPFNYIKNKLELRVVPFWLSRNKKDVKNFIENICEETEKGCGYVCPVAAGYLSRLNQV